MSDRYETFASSVMRLCLTPAMYRTETSGDTRLLSSNQVVQAYFSTSEWPRGFSGSVFDELSRRSPADFFDPWDLLAVQSLSVRVPVRPAIWLVSSEGQHAVSRLLRQVPTTVDLWDDEAVELMSPSGPMWQLWDLLRTANWPERSSDEEVNGLGGRTIRSKLLAAKRPRLSPILDQVVRDLIGVTVDDSWAAFRHLLCDPDRRRTLTALTTGAPPAVPLLRRIDVVLWMRGRFGVETDKTVGAPPST